MKLQHINDHLKYIQRGDYVKAVSGHFEGKRGWVSRVKDESACVCWTGVFEHGIWTDLKDLKRTKRFKDGRGAK